MPASADPLLLTTVVAVGLLVLFLSSLHASIGLLAITFSYMTTVSVWFVEVGLPDTRPVAAVIALAMLARSTARGNDRASATVVWCVLLFGSLSGLSWFWSQNPEGTLESFLAWPLLILVLIAVKSSDNRSMDVLGWFAAVVLCASLAAGLAGLPFAWEGGRLRGILENANGIGVLAALSGSFLASRRTRLGWAMWVVVSIACVLSGSRAGLLALAVGTAVVVWRFWGPGIRYIVFPGIVAVVLLTLDPLLALLTEGSLTITRTNNSRADVWALALDAHAESPWFGVGGGALETLSGSSALKVLAELGYVGVTAAAAMVLTLLYTTRHSALAFGLCLAGATNALFEGWLFAAGSPFAFVFYGLLTSVLANSSGKTQRLIKEPPATRSQPPAPGSSLGKDRRWY